MDRTCHENAAITKWSRRFRTWDSSTGIVKKVVHEHDLILVAILVARVSPLDSEFNLPADWNANFRMGVQPSVVVVGAVFEGTLTLSGYFRIDHEFCGELTTDGTVVVGADGAVVGNITGQAATDLPSPTVLGQALR
ncbi:MAG: polymer-forming cytoskeletal protein [Myxococcota bacterium]